MDLDLEADLGIDTVKQAEVFATIREAYGIERDDSLKLRDYPTLNHVVGVRPRPHAAAPRRPRPEAEPSRHPRAEHRSPRPSDGFPRRVPVPVAAPAARPAASPTGVELGEGSRVVLMPDRRRRRQRRWPRRLRQARRRGADDRSGARRRGARATLAEWRAAGPIHGVYWLPALDDEGPLAELDPTTGATACACASSCSPSRCARWPTPTDASSSPPRGSAGATATTPPARRRSLGGAVTGFTKALARERAGRARQGRRLRAEPQDGGARRPPDRRDAARPRRRRGRPRRRPALDGRPGRASRAATTRTHALDAGHGVRRHRRRRQHRRRRSPPTSRPPGRHLPPARPRRRARPGRPRPRALRHRPRRRSSASSPSASATRGERPTPKLVERELARHRAGPRRRSTRSRRSSAAGGTAHWHQVDLTDAEQVAVVARRCADSGRVDVLMHAPGSRSATSCPTSRQREYDLVFDVKADGWLNLLHALRDAPLGSRAIAFSSIAGRFGNAGQTDYAAANDLLCKSASQPAPHRGHARASRSTGPRGPASAWPPAARSRR